MQKIYFLIFLLFLSFIGYASNLNKKLSDDVPPDVLKKDFIGVLKYIEYTPFDTTYYKVFVTKDKIRIDTFNDIEEKGEANKIMIYNLKDNNILALKPSDHIYKLIDTDSESFINVDGCEVILNKKNYKYINNYKCVQYRIKNRAENTDITYWIPEEDFPFYCEMVSMKHSMQPVYKYFFMLPNHKVAFPMQTVERTLLREEKSSYKVVELNEIQISDDIFNLPSDYTLNE